MTRTPYHANTTPSSAATEVLNERMASFLHGALDRCTSDHVLFVS
jgi:hypothetical protein